MFTRALRDLRPYSRSLIILLVVSLSAVPITLITPLPLKLLVDNVVEGQPPPRYLSIFSSSASQLSRNSVLWIAVGLILVVAFATYFQNLVNVWASSKIGNRMTLDARDRLFRQMQR